MRKRIAAAVLIAGPLIIIPLAIAQAPAGAPAAAAALPVNHAHGAIRVPGDVGGRGGRDPACKRRRERRCEPGEQQQQEHEGMVVHEQQQVLDVVVPRPPVHEHHETGEQRQKDEHRPRHVVQEHLGK